MDCKYVKRKLGVRDLMPVVRMISKLRISDFQECFSRKSLNGIVETAKGKLQDNTSGQEKGETQGKDDLIESVGAEIAFKAADILLQNLPLIEDDLMEFLASMCGMKPKEYRELPPSALIVTLREIFSSEEAKDFFTEAARLVNWNSSSGISSTEDMPIPGI